MLKFPCSIRKLLLIFINWNGNDEQYSDCHMSLYPETQTIITWTCITFSWKQRTTRLTRAFSVLGYLS